MKKFFTLCVLAFAAIFSKAQVVLNEVYPEPGASFQEFFELYNTSTSQTPENLDNYTLVVYYEEPGNKSGFYIFDLPNQTVNAKSFYVGAPQSPFAIQVQSGLSANLNWNALPASAALTKWEKSGSSYISVPVAANLNDLFVRNSGSGSAAYNAFIYKNGMLINGVIGSTNTPNIPAAIKSMPNLFVDMTGSSPDFTLNFSLLADNSVEYVSANAGNDNGYYRQYDGKCGVWVKSSSGAEFTPGKSNGSAVNSLGSLTIAAFISIYDPNPYKSLFTYNVTGGPAEALPVVIEVYEDLGIAGELDANDVLISSKNIPNILAGPQEVIMPTTTDAVILVAKSPAGCFDRVMAIANPLSTLPVHLMSFQGNMNKNNKVTLNWTVADNETANTFEIERSFNGRDFTTAGVVFASEKMGTENYTFYETVSASDKVMYRLKMIDKNREVSYSKILIFQSKTSATNDIKIIGNPVNDKLTFSYNSNIAQQVSVKVYDLAGKTLMNKNVISAEGNNTLSLSLASTFKPGMYIVEVSNGTDRQVAKFVKQ